MIDSTALDKLTKPEVEAIIDARLLRLLKRERPYTRAVPFGVVALPVDGSLLNLYQCRAASFVIVAIHIRATVANIDLNICDTSKGEVIAKVVPSVNDYKQVDLHEGVKSTTLDGKVMVENPANTVADIEGVLYVYEVTREGHYR